MLILLTFPMRTLRLQTTMSGYIMFYALLLLQFSLSITMETEPFCLSKYDYDYKVLSKLVELEQKQTQMEALIKKQDEVIQQQEQTIQQQEQNTQMYFQKAEDKVSTFEDRFKDMERTERPSVETPAVSGSTYVRWGRTECPENGTETVYSGYVGGSKYDHSGAAVNYLCLPSDPLWGQYDEGAIGDSYVYGAEYQMSGSTSNKLFNNKDLYNNDAPCAVCRSTRVSILMIPGRNACYGGWTMEYTGYLVSGRLTHSAATEYICLDKDPEIVPGGDGNDNEKLLYFTEAKCGSLKCPPYVNGRELTCSVCTR